MGAAVGAVDQKSIAGIDMRNDLAFEQARLERRRANCEDREFLPGDRYSPADDPIGNEPWKPGSEVRGPDREVTWVDRHLVEWRAVLGQRVLPFDHWRAAGHGAEGEE